jgi:3-phenylpropionate/trans-cinnamate dioxygenase ferredoxin reductase component
MKKEEDMPHYNYLVIGGGMTADAAIDGIRDVDPDGSIGLLSAEEHLPYNRPPLTKGLWKGRPLEKIFRKTIQKGAEVHTGCEAVSLDLQEKRVTDQAGNEYTYDKLLLATGGSPRQLPFGGEHILYYRTLDDYQKLRQQVEAGGRFTVIGGGFIGSEIAAALQMQGQKVSMVFPEAGIGARLFPADLAEFINQYYVEKGVEVLPGEWVNGLHRRGEALVLTTKSGREISGEQIVAGIGILPNTGLAEGAGIEIEDGILVDESLRTNQPDVYAAGDVASFYNPLLGKRMRVEHEDNANTMGRAAGRNMAGEETPYHHLPYFYSDLFDLGYEAVGDLNPELETFSDWQEPYRKGVIYYLENGRVRGTILWNVWDQVEAARDLIAEPGPFEAKDLKGRIVG